MSVSDPIFICGVQRSGTTLLAQLLSKHPAVRILWETHCYPFFWNPWFKKSIDISAVEKLWQTSYKKDPYLDNISSRLIDKGGGFSDSFDLLDKILVEFREIRGNPERVGEKTPSHIFYVPDIMKHNPAAQIIIMIRDPRAIFLSEKAKYVKLGKGYLSPEKIALRWNLNTELALGYKKRYGRNAVLMVKYEQLILNPKNILLDVCNFLNISFDQKMLNADIVNSSFNSAKSSGFSEESINRWKQQLSNEEIYTLESMLEGKMKRLDYPVFNEGKNTLSIYRVNPLKWLIFRLTTWYGRLFPSLLHYMVKDNRYRKLVDWV